MPLYKWLGNRVLTTAQNALLRANLSEFHSGYRIYSTRALNAFSSAQSNDFHFDRDHHSVPEREAPQSRSSPFRRTTATRSAA